MLSFREFINRNAFNISRGSMPQIRDIDWLKSRLIGLDIEFNQHVVDPSLLSYAQTDLDEEKIKAITETIKNQSSKPIIYSNDYVLIDGHHRAEAHRRCFKCVEGLWVNLPANNLLKLLQDELEGS